MKEEKQVFKVERIHFFDKGGSTKAFCNLMIMESFVVKGFRVVQGKEGLFVGMPQEKSRDGKWYETFSPVTRELRDAVQQAVLRAYEEEAGKQA